MCTTTSESFTLICSAILKSMCDKQHHSVDLFKKTFFSIFVPERTVSHAFGYGEAENHNYFDPKCRQPGAHWTSKWVISRKIIKKFNFLGTISTNFFKTC